MSIGFCSLDEAWGTSMCPENTNNVKTYSNFEKDTKQQHPSDVLPKTEIDKLKENRNIDLDNVSNKIVVNTNMLKQNNRNIVNKANPN